MISSRITVAFVLGALLSFQELPAATVDYQGYLYHDQLSPIAGSPVAGGFVIAGTFAPDFDVPSFFCTYGDDVCNAASNFYSNAVADGAFRPIGDGVLTDGSGFFSGTGTTLEPAGTPIYLFAFGTGDPDASDEVVLATSSDTSFFVPADMGSTTVDAAVANNFVHGHPLLNGFAISLVPIPEPSTFLLTLVGAVGGVMCFGRKRRNRSN